MPFVGSMYSCNVVLNLYLPASFGSFVSVKKTLHTLLHFYFCKCYDEEGIEEEDEKAEEQVPRGYIRCDLFVDSHLSLLSLLSSSSLLLFLLVI